MVQLSSQLGFKPQAQPAFCGVAHLIAGNGAGVGLPGIRIEFFLCQRTGEVDLAIHIIPQDLQAGMLGGRDFCHHIEDAPPLAVVLAVPVIGLVAVCGHHAVIIGAQAGFQPIADQPERSELVELCQVGPMEVKVVEEVDNAPRGIGIHRRRIALDHLDAAERVEIDGFDTGLAVGFRLRDIVQQYPHAPYP